MYLAQHLRKKKLDQFKFEKNLLYPNLSTEIKHFFRIFSNILRIFRQDSSRIKVSVHVCYFSAQNIASCNLMQFFRPISLYFCIQNLWPVLFSVNCVNEGIDICSKSCSICLTSTGCTCMLGFCIELSILQFNFNVSQICGCSV